MDDLDRLALHPAVAAYLFEQGYVDRKYERKSREHRRYSILVRATDGARHIWSAYYRAHVLPDFVPDATPPNRKQYRRMCGALDRARVQLEQEWSQTG
jgi:hypothetical protein